MARRVGDVPVIISSQGTTRILLQGSIYYEPLPVRRRKKDTHEDAARTFGVVYVNDVGRAAMLSEKPAKFPAGSIIVREKLAQAADAQPQLLAVMFKRERGFNPKANDWEFLIADGAGTKIQARQKKGSCLQCHAAERARDFVFPPPAPK